jgi:two-component system sensor histidine kinase CpxA
VSVSEAVDLAIRREAAEGAQIQVNLDRSIHAQADMDYLVRAIGNVLRNAVRYAGKNGPITVGCTQTDDEVVLTISDCGPGVPDADLDRIFMPFYRIDVARDRRTGGTGLGLAIVRSCIEACGGRVSGKNRQPSGLEITMTLPAA